jgi:hypothetical protein
MALFFFATPWNIVAISYATLHSTREALTADSVLHITTSLQQVMIVVILLYSVWLVCGLTAWQEVRGKVTDSCTVAQTTLQL